MILLLACAMLLATSSAFATERIHQPLIVEKNFSIGDTDSPIFTVNSTNGETVITTADPTAVDNLLTVSGNSTQYIDSTGHFSLRDYDDGHQIFNVTTAETILDSDNITLDGDVNITGATNSVGDFTVATDKFTVASATGNTDVAGDLHVVGTISADGGIQLDASDLVLGGSLEVTGTTSLDKVVVMHDSRIFAHKQLSNMHTNSTETDEYVTATATQNIFNLSIPNEGTDLFSATVEINYHSTLYAQGADGSNAWVVADKFLYGQQFSSVKFLIFRQPGQDPMVTTIADSHYQAELYGTDTLLTTIPGVTSYFARNIATSYANGILTFTYIPCSSTGTNWPTAFTDYIDANKTTGVNFYPYIENQTFLYDIKVGTMGANNNEALWVY